jgi:hypothetical protein
VGKCVLSLVPLAAGPRHAGQLSLARALVAEMAAANTHATKIIR